MTPHVARGRLPALSVDSAPDCPTIDGLFFLPTTGTCTMSHFLRPATSPCAPMRRGQQQALIPPVLLLILAFS